MNLLDLDRAELIITSTPYTKRTDYERYFDAIRPQTNEEIFRRGLFAFASVHTTWQRNCQLYAQLWDLEWIDKPDDELKKRIRRSGAGLTNNRTRYIREYAQKYWKNPKWFLKQDTESWETYRNRIEEELTGLGHAKSSFFVELIYFDKAHVLVTDTHVIQMYGLNGNSSKARSLCVNMEEHWIDFNLHCNREPVTSRWIIWDAKQRQPDSRYWSYVLEGDPRKKVDPQLWLFPEMAYS